MLSSGGMIYVVCRNSYCVVQVLLNMNCQYAMQHCSILSARRKYCFVCT